MCNKLLSALVACVGVAIGNAAAAAQITAVPPAEYRPGPEAKAAPAELLTAPDLPSYAITLPEPTATEKAQLASPPAAKGSKRDATTSGKGRPLKIGFTRIVSPAASSIPMTSLAWQVMPDGGSAAR